MEYSLKKGITKALTAFALFAIPFAINVIPSDILNLTIGGVLALLANYIKVKLS